MSIAKEGLPFILVPFALTAVFFTLNSGALSFIVGSFFLLITLFCLFFFRDPRVAVPQEEGLVLSPCNGTVLDVISNEREQIVRVFLSIFNVHLQRAPVAGVVRSVEHRPGKFLAAWNPQAFLVNEQNIITIENEQGIFTVRQVAGFLARRCVSWVRGGDQLEKGQKLGLIKFSSQVDLHLPPGVSLSVKPGDKVIAGKTVFGVIE